MRAAQAVVFLEEKKNTPPLASAAGDLPPPRTCTLSPLASATTFSARPPTTRAASTARLTRLPLSSDLLRVAA